MKLTRRDLMWTLPLASAVSAIAKPKPHAGAQTNAWRINPADFSTFLAALDSIKKFQYEGFETGFRNVQPQFGNIDEAKRQIQDRGLKFFAVHIFLTQYDKETAIAPMDLVTKIADGGAALGAERLILSGRGLTEKGVFDEEAARRKASALNRAGQYAKLKNLRLCYHNHWFEFENGAREIQALCKHTDPSLVMFVMDAGHAMRAGADVNAFFLEHHKRLAGMHLRDFAGDVQVPLGSGKFDYAPLAASVKKTGWEGWILNEEERATDEKPGDSAIGPARETVRKLFGV